MSVVEATKTFDRLTSVRLGHSQMWPRVTLVRALNELPMSEGLNRWEALVRRSSNINVLFQSPAWFEHLLAMNSENLWLAVVNDDTDFAGFVPFSIRSDSLRFNVRRRILWESKLRTVSLLGGFPLLTERHELHDELFSALDLEFPDCDCVAISSVPKTSFLRDYLRSSELIREKYLVYCLKDFAEQNHSIVLPTTFQQYLAEFKSRKRWDLKRKLRKLQMHCAGQLSMQRFELPEEVGAFIELASHVAQRSWQFGSTDVEILDDTPQWRDKLVDLAQRGIFRSYILRTGNRPLASLLGYQFNGVFHYFQPGYDPAFKPFSPGTVLLYLLIEDLFLHNKPDRLYFGRLDTRYKQEFGNTRSNDTLIFLFRNTLAHRFRTACHDAFRSAILSLKKRTKRALDSRD